MIYVQEGRKAKDNGSLVMQTKLGGVVFFVARIFIFNGMFEKGFYSLLLIMDFLVGC